MGSLIDEGERPGGPGDRILFWPQVKDIAGVSRSTVWRMQRAGDFPVAIQISRGRVGWWESELTSWKLARAPRRLPEPRPLIPAPVQPAVTPERSVRSAGKPEPSTRVTPETPTAPASSASPGRRRHSATSPDQIAFDFGS